MAQITTGRKRSEARRRIVISSPSVCYYCKTEGLTKQALCCPNCGFPQNGSQAEMKRFLWTINNKHALLSEYADAIDKARLILISISILCLTLGLFLSNPEDKILRLSIIALSVVYFFIWHISKAKTKEAFLAGLIISALFILISGLLDPSSVFDALLAKGYVVVAFYQGYKSIKKGQLIFQDLELIKKAVNVTPQETKLEDKSR